MNKNIQKLYTLSKQKKRVIIGLMSGTSLDGLDIALCEIKGSGAKTKVKLKAFKTVDYPISLKNEIRKIFAKQHADLELLTLLNAHIGKLHGEWISEALKEWKYQSKDVDLIASHGQTVYHAPTILHNKDGYDNATLQIGDGDHIAVSTGIITLSDFRQKHIAAGGEGAPLALYGDYLIFSDAKENRVMLNMGGIANFTYLNADRDPAKVFVTDTGPGNTLSDAYTQKYFQREFDKDAAIAKTGSVNENLLSALKANDFFRSPIPKTTGPELFNLSYVEEAQRVSGTLHIPMQDVLITLVKFSADTIADALQDVMTEEKTAMYVSGGGAHNPLLMHFIKERFPQVKIKPTGDLGLDGDAKEAVLFAVLANEAVAGKGTDFNRKGMPGVTMGKISFPN